MNKIKSYKDFLNENEKEIIVIESSEQLKEIIKKSPTNTYRNQKRREEHMALNQTLRPGLIQLRVLDLDKTLDFYKNILGLDEVTRTADGRVCLKT